MTPTLNPVLKNTFVTVSSAKEAKEVFSLYESQGYWQAYYTYNYSKVKHISTDEECIFNETPLIAIEKCKEISLSELRSIARS